MALVANKGEGMFVLIETDNRKNNGNRTIVENNSILTLDPTPEADTA
jgi:hypothetical protein